MSDRRRSIALATKGFMPADEGEALWDAAVSAAASVAEAPMLEVGSYCGRSTVWLGDAAERSDRMLFAVDHHRGSEENQAGWEHHDTEVVDAFTGKMDTLPFFRRTMHDADLESSVIALVGRSTQAASVWTTPLSLLFIDGGHGEEPARLDYEGWTPHVAPSGITRDPRRLRRPGRRRPPPVRTDLPPGDRVRSVRGDVRDRQPPHPPSRLIKRGRSGCGPRTASIRRRTA